MLVNGLIRNNMSDDFDWQNMDYHQTYMATENETFYLNQNDSVMPEIVPQSLTSAIFLSTPPKSNRTNIYNSTNSRDEFQFYIIGIYSFFAVVFGFGLIIILFKRLQKACCTSSKEECQDYETVPSRDGLSPQDNLAFEHHVNVNYVDIEGRHNGHDSDFEEYHSDASNEDKNNSRDKPPAYEDPPSYSIVLQT